MLEWMQRRVLNAVEKPDKPLIHALTNATRPQDTVPQRYHVEIGRTSKTAGQH